jgi:hypothetical protein
MSHWVDERRQEPRYPASGRVHARVGERSWDAEVLDISLNGALLTKPVDCELQPGDRIEVELSFSGVTQLEASAVVAHTASDRCGVEFRGMSTADFDRFVAFILQLVGHVPEAASGAGPILVGGDD